MADRWFFAPTGSEFIGKTSDGEMLTVSESGVEPAAEITDCISSATLTFGDHPDNA